MYKLKPAVELLNNLKNFHSKLKVKMSYQCMEKTLLVTSFIIMKADARLQVKVRDG